MKKTLAFNWKMNPKKLDDVYGLAEASDAAHVIIFPPFIFLEEAKKVLHQAALGAQDLFWKNAEEDGSAYTGEVSGEELKNLGVTHVIVGHSERRRKLGETDAIVARKLKTAMEAGLTPILCVGETQEEKDLGKKEEVLRTQLEISLSLAVTGGLLKKRELYVAYEPVWAIGTGIPETPEDAAATLIFIRDFLDEHYTIKPHLLYGGSVDSKNIKNYIQLEAVDGALIGGASLKKEEIKAIVAIAQQLN